ncbi:DUF6624 domain-containing protein [Telluribacter sp.]|jgi:hypothetical protein|uniref:DUF6624 domain-containing protein n=1 Tax=Telluribacter sp. TaxID=1978767 RepID=UPI002E10491D|nr:DUF6624 domain-containing protein [Telluribacter sp.]
MKTLSLLSALIFTISASVGYAQFDSSLKAELDSIYKVDQFYREILAKQPKMDSLAKVEGISLQQVQQRIFIKMNSVDASNTSRVKEIIEQYGYPGKSIVGEPTNEAAWHVIQHSKDIEQYFPIVEEAGKKKEIPFTLVAKMLDRLLVNQGKEQIYGTQGRCDFPQGGSTQNQKPDCYIWPIADAAHVNERRKQAGFTDTIEENAKRLGIDYQPRSLSKK